MDQMKTGAFIANMRRDRNITQRELADKLGISDKTVSKWERGNGMPELSLMIPLCEELGVSLNELFRGEKLDEENYRQKADENLMDILRYTENIRINIVGGRNLGPVCDPVSAPEAVLGVNTNFWDGPGNDMLGRIVLPKWASHLPGEDTLGLLGDLSGKRVLEIGCGAGDSLKYAARMGAEEVWGLDISSVQIRRAQKLMKNESVPVRLLQTSMETAKDVPNDHFDVVFSVYGIGWTYDPDETFSRINKCLRPGGIFVFSWSHPIHKCTAYENDKLVFANSYFDESVYEADVSGTPLALSNRMMGTWINSLARNGFVVEKLIEESDVENINGHDAFAEKARHVPTAFVIRAAKRY